jgi:hypothetical protein
MGNSHPEREAASSVVVDRRKALLGLAWAAAVVGPAVSQPPPAHAAAETGKDAGLQPCYRETDHIRRFYACARF